MVCDLYELCFEFVCVDVGYCVWFGMYDEMNLCDC